MAFGQEAILKNIRYDFSSQNLRVVLDLNRIPEYSINQEEDNFVLVLPHTKKAKKTKKKIKIKEDNSFIEIKKENSSLKVILPGYEDAECIDFTLDSPPRLVIDFPKETIGIIEQKQIEKGLIYYKIMHRRGKEFSRVFALKADPRYFELKPAMAREEEDTLWETLFQFFIPAEKEKKQTVFKPRTVRKIVKDNDAIAGINGGYFSSRGYPLGLVMIDQTLLSSPMFQRTAFGVTASREYFVDNFDADHYFLVNDKTRYNITTINSQSRTNGVNLYTEEFGKKIPSKPSDLDIVVENSRVTEIKTGGGTDIPDNAYVISISGEPLEFISQNLKVTDKITLKISLFPFSYHKNSAVKHLLGGGPRLIKGGSPYVAKFSEQFRPDIAYSRAARSAIGITPEQNIIFLAVDGLIRKGDKNKNNSRGTTLEETARILQFLGAFEAMNLDGGGSSTLVLNDKLLNTPVNGSEIKVSNAIVICRKSNAVKN